MKTVDLAIWKSDLPAFQEKTAAFYAGEMKKMEYKGFSGYYGSYAQRDGKSSMLRLRTPAGCVTKKKLAFIAGIIREYGIKKMHFTTCQTIQLHDLGQKEVCEIMEKALDAGIITMGGGGDYPRNVMCSPLSGVEKGEYFDVRPWAHAVGEYLMPFIKAEKMPRKLKVGFSNSPANLTHATYRDLGFAAREDGKFDVYSAGGLGNNARMGVKVAEGVEPENVLYYVKAMWLTFRAYGNYENRAKARTRYMQDALGGPEKYAAAYREKLQEVFDSGEDLTVHLSEADAKKAVAAGQTETADLAARTADGAEAVGRRVGTQDPADTPARTADEESGKPEKGAVKSEFRSISGYSRLREQKTSGLYTVEWHPIGGLPSPAVFCAVADAISETQAGEMRLSPDETAFLVNLTVSEAEKILELTKDDTAASLFETSVSCIGASICQVGLRDSQGLLKACIRRVREEQIPADALPRIHISGCTSSCGTHQTGVIGFRGASRSVDGKARPAFVIFVNGSEGQGEERFGQELGAILEEDVPEFLVTLGKKVAESGMDFTAWNAANPEGLVQAAEPYLR